VGQAVAVRIDGDMAAFKNCRFMGYQDTLYPHGEKSRQYYRNCYIEGSVDFIFGWSNAVFENCTIFCKSKGYICAPSTLKENAFGFTFLNCVLIGTAPVNSVYLGRPWRPYGRSVFINCTMDSLIRLEGWHNWNKIENESTAYFAEHNNSGPGANNTDRVKWSRKLSASEAADYTLQNILGDWVTDPDLFINSD
jgi:pectinesterase